MRTVVVPDFRAGVLRFNREVVNPVLHALIETGTLVLPDSDKSVPEAVRTFIEGPLSKAVQIVPEFWREHGCVVAADHKCLLARIGDATTFFDANLVSVSQWSSADQVKMLFLKGFYGVGFSTPDLWAYLIGEPATKAQLCDLFLENSECIVCPYCDCDTASTQYYFEHFVPKSKVPLLAVHPYNLFVACNACNSPQVGKGERLFLPLAFPGFPELARGMDFKLGSTGIKVSARDDPFFDPVRKYIEMLRLEDRYDKKQVHLLVVSRVARVLESAGRNHSQWGLAEVLTYLNHNYRDEVLNLASRAVLCELYWASL
jgi:hypothetical protein